ncbi:type VI secretion system baseplate subunit TssE [Deltaproteobacteria bacterium Smac51]|nr:type VI secretion system baseplate subunit TssE [Deltaproteobacteria bacterium Smac51]
MPGSLFERLTSPPDAAEIDEDESIRRHIERMLTARRGSVQALPDYGLPDLNDLSYSKSDLLAECCRFIAESLENYEPRLTRVKVEPQAGMDDPLTLAFTINAFKTDEHGNLIPWNWTVPLGGRL